MDAQATHNCVGFVRCWIATAWWSVAGGRVVGLPLNATVTPLGSNSYSFKFDAAGAPNLPTSPPSSDAAARPGMILGAGSGGVGGAGSRFPNGPSRPSSAYLL